MPGEGFLCVWVATYGVGQSIFKVTGMNYYLRPSNLCELQDTGLSHRGQMVRPDRRFELGADKWADLGTLSSGHGGSLYMQPISPAAPANSAAVIGEFQTSF